MRIYSHIPLRDYYAGWMFAFLIIQSKRPPADRESLPLIVIAVIRRAERDEETELPLNLGWFRALHSVQSASSPSLTTSAVSHGHAFTQIRVCLVPNKKTGMVWIRTHTQSVSQSFSPSIHPANDRWISKFETRHAVWEPRRLSVACPVKRSS